MAYSDYLHCYRCGEKALYWEQWEYIGCAHCPGDLANAERGVVEVYCPECTAARNTTMDESRLAPPKPSTMEPVMFHYDPGTDQHAVEDGGVMIEYEGSDPLNITITTTDIGGGTVEIPLRTLPLLRTVAARVIDLAARTGTKEDPGAQG